MIATNGLNERTQGGAGICADARIAACLEPTDVKVTFYFIGSLALRMRRDGCILNLASGSTLQSGMESIVRGAQAMGVDLSGTSVKAFINGVPASPRDTLTDDAEVLLVPAAVLFHGPERMKERGEGRRISGLHHHTALS